MANGNMRLGGTREHQEQYAGQVLEERTAEYEGNGEEGGGEREGARTRGGETRGVDERGEESSRRGRGRKPRSERTSQRTSVKVASLNMNGFGTLIADHQGNKWGKMYRMMAETRTGVLLLQETHLTQQRVDDIHRMYAGRIKVFHSQHESAPTQKEGVAVVINKKIISANGAKASEIVKGRALQIEIKWRGGDTRNILCMYAPTSDGVQERATFFREVATYYERNPNVPRPHMMAGDFNNVEDPVDRAPVPATTQDASVMALDELKVSLGMSMADGWRRTYPTEKAYTFQRGEGSARTMARLDRIYMRTDMERWAREWTIEPVGVKTDHSMVAVTMTTPTAPAVGKGRPIFPMYLLKDKVLAKQMKERGLEAVNEMEVIRGTGRTEERNAQVVVASMKRDWLNMARKRELETAPKLMREISELEKRQHALRSGRGGQPEDTEDDLAAVTDQLKRLKEKRYVQQQAKARAKHRVEGERPTKYWVNLQKENAPREIIDAFEVVRETREGQEKWYETDPRKMAEMARAHYDGVQDGAPEERQEGREQDIREVLGAIEAAVDEDQATKLDRRINREEVQCALAGAKAGTAPGLDGVQYEVWKTVHARYVEDRRHEGRATLDVVGLLAEMYRDISEHGVCAKVPFAEGWIAPIYKEKGEKTKVENYRPITLLNTDYKLMTKVLAVRLAEVAPEIIHPAQAGFVPGRRLKDHTQLAKLMIDWAEVEGVNGAIVALDQEKAYDKIDHEYLWRVMSKFGIPASYINIVKALYEGAKTSVAVNGVTSKPYAIRRGVRQGDPLSCLLFDLAIEPLSAMIRTAKIKGLAIPGTTETLKATLFADDTTAYLADNDSFEEIQKVLDKWCSAARARFNIKKTEIIPVGTVEYRREAVEEARREGRWGAYPAGARVATDGEPVRVLGAFIGNRVDQAAVWTTKIEKVRGVLERWKRGRATLAGKKHAAQMTVGGMTQFLADVQRMPQNVMKRLEKLLRDYMWDDKKYVPISTETLQGNVKEGGVGLIDLEARNEAMDVVWLRDYLSFGKDRPTWAKVADALMARAAPKATGLKKEDLRLNMFLQHWHPKLGALPTELKAMIKVARKYGLTQDGMAIARSIQREMPIWAHAKADELEMRKLMRASVVVRCMTKNHKVRTVGDCEDLAAGRNSRSHAERRTCNCNECERRITEERCAHPDKCYERAEKLLNLLPRKWDPRGAHPEDHETQDRAGQNKGEGIDFDRSITTKGTMGDTMRIFTEGARPSNEPSPVGKETTGATDLVVATDGSCRENGSGDARAGFGVFVEERETLSMNGRIPTNLPQTNQVAEIYAMIRAVEGMPEDRALVIESDSMTTIKAMTTYLRKHEDRGYIGVQNSGALRKLAAALRLRKTKTALRWVKGHSGHERNEEADKLAGEGATQAEAGDADMNPEAEMRIVGAKLQSITQKLAYKAIREVKAREAQGRESTRANMERATKEIHNAYGRTRTPEEVWASFTNKHITRECRQFLWRAMHDGFMIGRHWQRAKMPEALRERATCKKCGVLESMDHILFECEARGQKECWDNLRKILRKAGLEWKPPSWGVL